MNILRVSLAITIFLLSLTAFSMPYRCRSSVLKNGVPELTFKINEKDKDNQYIIGVTPLGKPKFVIFGTGNVEDRSIGLNFVQKNYLLGYFTANKTILPGILRGKISHPQIGSPAEVICRNLELYPEN